MVSNMLLAIKDGSCFRSLQDAPKVGGDYQKQSIRALILKLQYALVSNHSLDKLTVVFLIPLR